MAKLWLQSTGAAEIYGKMALRFNRLNIFLLCLVILGHIFPRCIEIVIL